MMQKPTVIGALAGIALLLGATQAEALERCIAKIKANDGTIEVSARNVSGPLKWGWTATTRIQPFSNSATCVSRGRARKCTQGAAGTLLAITPPPDCTLHLEDGAGECTAFLKKCTPGTRPLVEFPTRFIDNLDGTVSDTRTGLMWEKKSGNDWSIHDPESLWNWSSSAAFNPDGSLFMAFLAGLNGGPTPFAGHSDWRLPTPSELLTIRDCSFGSACVDETAFGPSLPSHGPIWWTSTTQPSAPGSAEIVNFSNGTVGVLSKTIGEASARAVRGGP